MAEYPIPEPESEIIDEDIRQDILNAQSDDPIVRIEQVYQLWWHWADFSLYIITPTIAPRDTALIIGPELIPGTEDYEFVYPIHDFGHKLTTSKAEDMYTAGMSMCKLHYTIEKMIALLIQRVTDGDDGEGGRVTTQTEVQVAFGGHELAQRKAFESIINLDYNVVVTNFDPGLWGERYLQNVKRMADKGYGYPEGSPRDIYQRHPRSPSPGIRR